MKIKMLETTKGSPDGFTVRSYVAGKEYSMSGGPAFDLAKVFVEQMKVAKYVIVINNLSSPKAVEVETPEKVIEIETPEKVEIKTPKKVIVKKEAKPKAKRKPARSTNSRRRKE